MKRTLIVFVLAAFAIGLAGCQTYVPSNSVRTVTYSAALKADDVLDAAVDAARDSGLPAMSKLDKANGVVEFGGFEGPELGISAQVRIHSGNQAEITIKRGSVIIPLKADADADTFKSKLEEHLNDLANKTAK